MPVGPGQPRPQQPRGEVDDVDQLRRGVQPLRDEDGAAVLLRRARTGPASSRTGRWGPRDRRRDRSGRRARRRRARRWQACSQATFAGPYSSAVASSRLEGRQQRRVRTRARRRVVGVHRAGRDEDPALGAVGERREGAAHLAGLAGHVDHEVPPLAGREGGIRVRVGAVGDDEPRAVGRRSAGAAGEAGDVVARPRGPAGPPHRRARPCRRGRGPARMRDMGPRCQPAPRRRRSLAGVR